MEISSFSNKFILYGNNQTGRIVKFIANIATLHWDSFG